MKRLALLLVCFGLCLPMSSHAVIRFIAPAPTGNNSNSCAASAGTVASPSASPKLTFDNAIRCMVAGDILYARAGTYHENIDSNNFASNSFPVGASFSNAVTIASYPGDATHPAETALITGTVNLPHPYLQYVIFSRLTFDGTGINRSTVSIGSNGAHHLRFADGEIRNTGQGTAQEICGNNDANVIAGGHHHEFLRNKVHHSRWSYGFYWTANNSLIEGNEIYNNDGYAIQFYNGSTCDADGNIFRNNKLYANGFTNSCGATFGMILNCAHNNQLINNLIYTNRTGIEETNNATGNSYLNNTIYNNPNGPGLHIQNSGTGAVAQNNIVYLNGAGITGSGFTQDHNLTTNPTFVNPGSGDFHLQTLSAAKDTGTCLPAVPTDRDGVAKPQGSTCDIGAYEFVASTGAPAQLAFTSQPSSTMQNQIIPNVRVTVQDSSGNPVSSSTMPITVSLASNPAGGILGGTLTKAAVAGVATFSLSIDTVGTYTLGASASGVTSATSASFPIVSAGATHLAFVAHPQGVLVNQVMPDITVRFLDSAGTVVNTTQSVSLSLGNNTGGGTLGGTVTRAAVAGTATFQGLFVTAAGVGKTLHATAAISGGAGTLSTGALVVTSVDSAELAVVDPNDPYGYAGTNAIDGITASFWHTRFDGATPPYPHQIILDGRGLYGLTGITYLPRQDGNGNGLIAGYQVYLSLDGVSWDGVLASGTWTAPHTLKTVTFPLTSGRYMKLVGTSGQAGTPYASAAEITLLGYASSNPFTVSDAPAEPTPVCAGSCAM